MDGSVTAFGKRVTPGIASQVLQSTSLNQAPSPAQPEHAPSSKLANLYAQLYAIAEMATREEQDVGKRLELERIVMFADSALGEAASKMGSDGAPVPTLPVPQPSAPAPMGAMPGMPPAAPPPQLPGAAAAPPPPGVPA